MNKENLFFKLENLIVPLEAENKDSILDKLLNVIIENNHLSMKDHDELYKQLLEREEKGSTGIGREIAIPHLKTPLISTIQVSVGICPLGMDFDAIDTLPVKVFFLVMTPTDIPNAHIQFLSFIGKHLRSNTEKELLISSKNPTELLNNLLSLSKEEA